MKTISLLLCLALPVFAQTTVGPAVMPAPGTLIQPQQYLAEKAGIVSWRTLAQVSPVKEGKKIVPSFDSKIERLDGQSLKVQGFIMPLQMGDKQTHFLLSAAPPHCTFCVAGGPESMIEVKTKTPIKYGFDPIVLSGKLQVLKDDPMGLYYRIVDAKLE
jgi:uncharacterized protein